MTIYLLQAAAIMVTSIILTIIIIAWVSFCTYQYEVKSKSTNLWVSIMFSAPIIALTLLLAFGLAHQS